MSISTQLAKHMRDVFFGGNWTVSNLRDNLKGVTWEQAITKIDGYNTIAVLTFHIHYFVGVAMKVLQGGPLIGDDKLSFAHPPINSQADWEGMQNRIWADAEIFAALIEQLPDNKLSEDFADTRYGTYYRNIAGIIEHTHYHLGQIVIIKKLLEK